MIRYLGRAPITRGASALALIAIAAIVAAAIAFLVEVALLLPYLGG